MKVNPRDLQAYGRTNANGVQNAQKAREAAAAQKAASATTSDGSAARVSISDEARKLASTKSVDATASAESAAKVADLKDRVDRGEYKVDAQLVARKMVDDVA